ncbi:uncharacterized protein L969DRAFT_609983 [Mixia osmundae IAM 14324]|uniref:Uncharacterized protein n=1 Tax=Mixia osmundae (strain CBS 9802 / IAM 14324 / JCM 22182 / KY 12970) TaxID=764103 RepID=G7EAU0_MIXOS|nr:uncharacterized protein L969DRAFT_609983 [Mixia osmundae IAM 14324]KEI36984.1 hypothetical protein L969DRAFT_609983 [Mixia osmundae IAM 14324]GAA99950.1 hypothetical protein E5Q_06653 [Mixia osmundae IAM 14324]
MSRDLSDRLPLMLQVRGSVYQRIRWRLLGFAAFAAVAAFLDQHNVIGEWSDASSSALPMFLSMLVSMMVSFRFSSSLERLNEGRRLWASLLTQTRVFARAVSFAPIEHTPSAAKDSSLKLLVAFAYALKSHLRDEAALDEPMLPPLLSFELLQAAKQMARRSNHVTSEADRELSALNDDSHFELARRSAPSATANLPLIILRHLHVHLNCLRADKTLEISDHAFLNGILREMTDIVTKTERIKATPIPMCLGIHLQQMLTLYLMSIPLQLVGQFGYGVIPITVLAAHCFLGVDASAEELSDPFGREENDLPLDQYCSDIHREWQELVQQGRASGAKLNDVEPVLPGSKHGIQHPD